MEMCHVHIHHVSSCFNKIHFPLFCLSIIHLLWIVFCWISWRHWESKCPNCPKECPGTGISNPANSEKARFCFLPLRSLQVLSVLVLSDFFFFFLPFPSNLPLGGSEYCVWLTSSEMNLTHQVRHRCLCCQAPENLPKHANRKKRNHLHVWV